MKELNEARLKINEIDAKMIELFKERFKAIKEVLDYKKAHNLEVFDASREEALIKKNKELLNDRELEKYYLTFLEGMLKASKDYQKDHYLKFGLLGHKLFHSCSPIIYKNLFERNHLDASYELLDIEEAEVKTYMDKLRNNEYKGFNVTIPYKQTVIPFLDELSSHAKEMGAVNVIINKDGKLIGHNTDFRGFKEQLAYQKVEVKDKDVYVLGNGGAAKAIIYTLNLLKARVHIVNRHNEGVEMSYQDLENLEHLDVIVNTTPVGMYPKVDACPVSLDVINKTDKIVDIIYNPRKTKLLTLKGEINDGLPMLIFQALEAVKIWFNHELDYDFDELIEACERKINGE